MSGTGINELVTASIGYFQDSMQLDLSTELHPPEASCSFPDCSTTATWIARGHRPCSHPVLACDDHKAKTDRDLSRIIPGWVCSKCRTFAPASLAEAINWRHL